MPFAQLRELVIALIEPPEPVGPARAVAPVEPAAPPPLPPIPPLPPRDAPFELRIDRRPAEDRFAEGTIDHGVERAAYRLTVTATNDRGDCAFVVDSPTQPITAMDRTAQDAQAFTRTAPAVDGARGTRDDLAEDPDDDPVDDFDAQPTAYRVRTTALDTVIASSPPR